MRTPNHIYALRQGNNTTFGHFVLKSEAENAALQRNLQLLSEKLSKRKSGAPALPADVVQAIESGKISSAQRSTIVMAMQFAGLTPAEVTKVPNIRHGKVKVPDNLRPNGATAPIVEMK